MRRPPREWQKPRRKSTPKRLWTQPDQNQDDDNKPHCCGVCDDSPGGNKMGGMV